MTAISRSLVRIWVVAASAHPSTLSASVWSTSNTSGYIAGQIKSYTKSGGETDVESDPVFGGYVDKEKPASQYELELELVPAIESTAYEWETVAYALDSTSGTAVYTSKAIGSDRAVYVQANSGSAYKSWGFNNCNVVVLDQEHSADDNLSQTLRLKFAPTDSSGIPNLQYSKQAASSLTAWGSLSVS